MQGQRKELNFEGEKIYSGIDSHLKSWRVTILTERLHHKTFTQPPDPKTLVSYLKKNFPGATYYSAYEAGFSGFWIHYELAKMNVNNIVVNAADVPTTQKEKLQKTDTVDSNKIARALRAGELAGIYIPSVETMEARSLLRARGGIVKDLTRMKQRVKSMLHLYGVKYPPAFEKSTSHWSKRFMAWLDGIEFSSQEGRDSLSLLVASAKESRKILLDATRRVRALSGQEKYKENYRLISSTPGVALITGMTFLTEVEDISRFRNTDRLAGYVGLVPTSHSSGENDVKGEMTFRGQTQLRMMLIESAWIAARADPALCLAYSHLVQKMEPNKAIVRIARKLLNRIYHVLKYKKEYVCAVVK